MGGAGGRRRGKRWSLLCTEDLFTPCMNTRKLSIALIDAKTCVERSRRLGIVCKTIPFYLSLWPWAT